MSSSASYSAATNDAANTIMKSMQLATSVLTQVDEYNYPQEVMEQTTFTTQNNYQHEYLHINRHSNLTNLHNNHKYDNLNVSSTSGLKENNNVYTNSSRNKVAKKTVNFKPLTNDMEAQLKASIVNAHDLLAMSKIIHDSPNIDKNKTPISVNNSNNNISPYFQVDQLQETQQQYTSISPIPQEKKLYYDDNNDNSLLSRNNLNLSSDFNFNHSKGSDQISQLYEECEKLLKLNADLQQEQNCFDESFNMYIETESVNQ